LTDPQLELKSAIGKILKETASVYSMWQGKDEGGTINTYYMLELVKRLNTQINSDEDIALIKEVVRELGSNNPQTSWYKSDPMWSICRTIPRAWFNRLMLYGCTFAPALAVGRLKLAQLSEVFQVLDDDGSGEIGAEEFEMFISKVVGHTVDENSSMKIKKLIESVDRDGDMEVGFTEFCTLMTMGQTDVTRELIECTELFREWFSLIDPRGQGYFDLEELINFLKALGGDVKEEHLQLIRGMDTDGDNSITFIEFAHVLLEGEAGQLFQVAINTKVVECKELFTIFDQDGSGTVAL